MIFFETVGRLLSENHIDVSVEISQKLEHRYASFFRESGLSDESVTKWRAELIAFIGAGILAQSPDNVTDEVVDWAAQTAEGAVQHGVGIDELMFTVRCYREVIWEYVERKVNIDQMRPTSVLKVNRIIDTLLDQTAQTFSISYVRYNTQTIKAAQKAFNEISFPVVALSDRVAILPLIGELDEGRASILLENVLPKCKDLKIEELILDLSGVPHIDNMTADKLFQLKHSLDLIGISLTFTGIGPKLALPMVNLGIPLNQLNIKGTLKNAISTYKMI
ncbi:STAS domain-containing protein [Domibacillus robiginosus]|uniref:STAS domain-containing protein n=1 Tax=Domibacillus robiginosus TaxID=1071054 RepID=UPI00067E2D94|nr:STAS domain-containing protein [Domibacillus robiginosus]